MKEQKTLRPLKITYHMAAPIYCTGHAIHLDSLLAFVAVHVAGYFNSSVPVGWEPDEDDCPPLPLARQHHGDR